MQNQRAMLTAPQESRISPLMLILCTGGCFAVGFAGLMLAPALWPIPRYVATPTVERPPAEAAVPASAAAKEEAPKRAATASPLIETIHSGGTYDIQHVGSVGTLTRLAQCKEALGAGDAYQGITVQKAAAIMGASGALTPRQITEFCRRQDGN